MSQCFHTLSSQLTIFLSIILGQCLVYNLDCIITLLRKIKSFFFCTPNPFCPHKVTQSVFFTIAETCKFSGSCWTGRDAYVNGWVNISQR